MSIDRLIGLDDGKCCMSVTYDPADLPPETVEVNGYVWTREQFDSDAYQWVREMEEDEYDWDASKIQYLTTLLDRGASEWVLS